MIKRFIEEDDKDQLDYYAKDQDIGKFVHTLAQFKQEQENEQQYTFGITLDHITNDRIKQSINVECCQHSKEEND